MTAFNIVRMRVKPGHEEEYLDMHRRIDPAKLVRMRQAGMKRFSLVRTGERAYCFVGEWDSFDGIVQARPEMIEELDRMRGILEDLGDGLGVTDPISGEAAVSVDTQSTIAAE
ncbi:MAG: L-rhamnose mutarotase [Rhizobiaceae bacterium]|nr:L-rhamnose mutarotase [Rhizobiaceae bacterium]MCV0405254.1 L-rhamnose mutarotase [Rhizobiaceae bacterium]